LFAPVLCGDCFSKGLDFAQYFALSAFYRKILPKHFNDFGGVPGYIEHLRKNAKFRLIDED
jgi:hypothetical protein